MVRTAIWYASSALIAAFFIAVSGVGLVYYLITNKKFRRTVLFGEEKKILAEEMASIHTPRF